MESIIALLIYCCLIALVLYLIFWVLESIGLALPPMVVRIIIVIAILCVLLLILKALPGLGLHFPRL